jgi:hypothetical protein
MRKFLVGAALLFAVVSVPAQQMVTETFDPAQPQDADFAKSVKEWTTQPYFISPLVDHLPLVKGIPTPKAVLGYHIGAPYKLTYYADILKYYRALAAATPRVKIETIGKSDEGRELVVVWVSSDENIKNVQKNRDNLAKIGGSARLTPDQIKTLIQTTKPHYHHGRTAQRQTAVRDFYGADPSPRDRDLTAHQADSRQRIADHAGRGSRRRDRNVDWFWLRGLTSRRPIRRHRGAGAGGGAAAPDYPTGQRALSMTTTATSPSQVAMRSLVDGYFTAHPPIMHDLHRGAAAPRPTAAARRT